MFTKNDLKTGMFGVMDDGEMFIVIDNKMVYQNRGYDFVDSLDGDLSLPFYKISKVYDKVVSFQHLRTILATKIKRHYPVYDREKDIKPLYNGKVVCIDPGYGNEGTYTLGKIYYFQNGNLIADDGNTYPGVRSVQIRSFEDWKDWTTAKFIGVVE